MKHLLHILFICSGMSAFCTSYDTLYINKGTGNVGVETSQFCFFNKTSNFEQRNHHMFISNNENLELHVVNNDSIVQNFSIESIITQDIPAFGSIDISLPLLTEGSYRYYSNKIGGELLGASGIIISGYNNQIKYGWNMYELQRLRNDSIALNLIDPNIPYLPDYFLINANHHPNTMADSTTKVMGNVNDTIIIAVANSGRILHSLHFHGYHVEILHSNKSDNFQIGWSKDSFGINVGEVITVRLIPDKEGEYPVHDHNLRAVTNSGLYPGGMITRLSVQP